jgi:hypothetical protein
MVAQQPAAGVLRVVFNGSLSGRPTANVMHWLRTSGVGSAYTQAQVDAVASGLRGAWVTNFNPRQSSNDWVLGTVTTQDLTSNVGLMGQLAGSSAGTRPGISLPANVALCVSWRVAIHYRGGHPRTYIGGLVQADQFDTTSWATASTASMLTAANGFLTAANTTFGGVTGQLVLLSRVTGGQVMVPPATYPITGAVIDTRIDSMRRRLGKDR